MSLGTILHKITLSDGQTMPLFGLGCWNMSPDEAFTSIQCAIKEGYRLFDTATWYDNEEMVGKALRESSLSRGDYFLVTKLLPSNHAYHEAKKNLHESLKKLQHDFVDLFLIHTPRMGNIIETWKAIVELKQEGLTKSIGVSNFNVQHLEPLLATGMEAPAVNQIELHPWNQQVKSWYSTIT